MHFNDKKEWFPEHFITTMTPERQQLFLTLRKVCELKHPLDPNKEHHFRRIVIDTVKYMHELNQKANKCNRNDVFFQWDDFLKELVDKSIEEHENFFNSFWFLLHNLSLHCSEGRDLNRLLSCFRAIMNSLSLENRVSIGTSVKWLKFALRLSGDKKEDIFKSILKCLEYFGPNFFMNMELDKTLLRYIDGYSDPIKKEYFYFLTKMPKYRYKNICYFFSKIAKNDLKAQQLMRCMLELDDKKNILIISRLYYLSKINPKKIENEIKNISKLNSNLWFNKIEATYRRSLKDDQKIYLRKWKDFCVQKETQIFIKKSINENPDLKPSTFFSDKTTDNNLASELYICSDPNIYSEKIFIKYPNSIPELYGIIFWQTSIIATQIIKKSKKEQKINLQCLLNYLSISRQGIEHVFQDRDPEEKTIGSNHYGCFRFSKSAKILDDGALSYDVNFEYLQTPFHDYIDKNHKVNGVPELEPKDLVLVDHPSKKDQKIKLTDIIFENEIHKWRHFRDAENYDDVILHLEKLFQLSLGSQESLDKLLENLGRLHWWLSHACLFGRGSAAISEMLITAILLHHGWLHSFWKQDICIDVVALCCASEDDFVRDYYNKNLLRHELQRLNFTIE